MTKRAKLFLSSTILVLLSGTSFAGRYELVEGNGVGVCEAYQMNLNSFMPAQPMVCERKINPKFDNFAKPSWQDIDVTTSKRLLWDTFSVFYPTIASQMKNPMSDEDLDRAIKKWINLRSQKLYKAQVDIDNDGNIENILKYNHGICGVAQFAYATPILVQYDDKPEIDREKTDLLIQNTWKNPENGEIKRDIREFLFNMYDVFQYKNVMYFDKVDERHDEQNNLYVYRISNNLTSRLCKYHFVNGEK
jgi:hypothetical protein